MALSTITAALYACACCSWCTSARRRACTTERLYSSVSPSKMANAAPWGSPRTAILPEGRSKGPASTVLPSPRALSMAASREGDREVREPEGRRVAVLLLHRHEAAVMVAGVLDRSVDDSSIVLDRLIQRLDIEELEVGTLHVRELVVEREQRPGSGAP